MSTSPQLPVFADGQILPAADLNALPGYARAQMARHERYLHDWGIAAGLALSQQTNSDSNNNQYADVTLQAGVAIDPYGAEIIVPADKLLDYTAFANKKIATKNAADWYPVLLAAQEQASTGASTTVSSCGSSQSSSAVQGYAIDFGHPGDDSALASQTGPTDVTTGTGTSLISAQNGTRLLVGYVQWSTAANRFAAGKSSVPGVGAPRYAGVQADRVTARGGSLTLSPASGAAPVAVLDTANGLQFGLRTAAGTLKPLFTVSVQGDVTVSGKLNSGVSAQPLSASGVVSDGMLLPLPSGVTAQQLAQFTLSVHLTPRYPGTPPPPFLPSDDCVMSPLECRLDGLRVRCRVRWVGPAQTLNLPGMCDYLVIASSQGAS